MMRRALLFISSCLLSHICLADDDHSKSKLETKDNVETERIQIVGQRIRDFMKGIKDEDITKTEILEGKSLRRHGAQTLAEAIKQARGIDTQLSCANCGAKRISINGLRGEHTTILIDSFPLHSTVSSFYGIDAVPIIGIEKVEVNRGAGSSLISPESIGGSINLITAEPKERQLKITSEIGSAGSHQTSMITSAMDQDSGLQVMAFEGFSPHWDVDENGLAETPQRSNRAITFQVHEIFSDTSTLKIRYSESDLLIIGGNTTGYRPSKYSSTQAAPEDFIDNDVRNRHIGSLDPITEVIDLTRKETALSFEHYLNDDSQLLFRLSSTLQHQQGIYSHAFDYNNQDNINFGGISYQNLINEDHLLTLGLEAKKQEMSSSSLALYTDRNPPLPKDNFNYTSRSFYLMDEWQVSPRILLSLALRGDAIKVNWMELDNSLEEIIAAPRFLALMEHNEHTSSRFTLGIGYRPPLTLFESQHGSSHDGFELAIDQIEKAYSGVYSFSLNYPSWFSTWSLHYTHLIHMPYAIDRISTRQPLLFVNSDENYDIIVMDWFFGGKSLHNGEWQLGLERYIYQNSYAEKLPTAAIEFRIQADWIQPSFLGISGVQGIYVGERDLSRYGYDENFNIYNTDISSPNFGTVSAPKKTKVPAYVQINLSHEIALSKTYNLKLRVANLTDFTQASVNDTPATWHWHQTHAHFDNFHTWGPNSGREYFVELNASL